MSVAGDFFVSLLCMALPRLILQARERFLAPEQFQSLTQIRRWRTTCQRRPQTRPNLAHTNALKRSKSLKRGGKISMGPIGFACEMLLQTREPRSDLIAKLRVERAPAPRRTSPLTPAQRLQALTAWRYFENNTIADTGSLVRIDAPRSPCSTPHDHSKKRVWKSSSHTVASSAYAFDT